MLRGSWCGRPLFLEETPLELMYVLACSSKCIALHSSRRTVGIVDVAYAIPELPPTLVRANCYIFGHRKIGLEHLLNLARSADIGITTTGIEGLLSDIGTTAASSWSQIWSSTRITHRRHFAYPLGKVSSHPVHQSLG